MGAYMVSFKLLQATLEAIAEQHGHVVDYKMLGQRLLISNHAARRRVQAFEEEGLVLLLPALGKIAGKKRVRRPRLYLRNIEGLSDAKKIQGSYIEEIIKQEKLRHPSSRFFHYSKYSGLTVDLIVERAEYRFGIQLNLPDSNFMSSHRPICSTVMEGVAKRGFVLHSPYRAFFAGRNVIALPFPIFLSRYEQLTEEKKRIQDMRIFMRWINVAQAARITSYTGRRL